MRAPTILALCLLAFGSIGHASADMAAELHELGVGTHSQ